MEEEGKKEVEVLNYAHVHIRVPFLFLSKETDKSRTRTDTFVRDALQKWHLDVQAEKSELNLTD